MALHFLIFAAAVASLGHARLAEPEQRPLQLHPPPASDFRALKGKFLHITDIHPDPYYAVHSSTEETSACHRAHGPAGAYGAETSDCDSPFALVNATFEWIAHNLRDEIDFVVWTGDSARHDNDDKLPRSQKATLEQNQMLVDKMYQVFGQSGGGGGNYNDYIIPIIPTFGNNDILPHNIFSPGPNQWTAEYSRIWHSFIPEEQRHQFDRGGWFYVEAIPNHLAVFSLNTMYFFDSNAAVDGCTSSEPGGEQFQWLRIQLQLLRMRGMKAILTGHVPPARSDDEGGKTLWDETCWQRHALWLRQYRDVIVGSIYGHMNVEHFLLQDFADIKWKVASDGLYTEGSGLEEELHTLQARWSEEDLTAVSDRVSIAGSGDYLNALREQWRRLPDVSFGFPKSDSTSKEDKKLKNKLGGEWAERFALTQVSASVVPNYFPTLRVFEYNITGLQDVRQPVWNSAQVTRELNYHDDLPELDSDSDSDDEAYDDIAGHVDTEKHKKHKKKKKKKPKKPKFTVPDGPSKLAPPGPAYSPQALSFIGYTQYFANLTRINNDFLTLSDAVVELPRSHQPLHDEDALYDNPAISNITAVDEDNYVDALRWRPGKHHEKHPKGPKPRPLDFEFEVEYNTTDTGDIFGLALKKGGLIVRNYVELASRIGKYRPKNNDLLHADESVFRDSKRYDWVANDEHGNEVGMNKHKKHKKKKGKKRRIVNKTWYAFVDRATVATMDPSELHENFGDPVDEIACEAEQDSEHEKWWFARAWRNALLSGWGV